MTNGQNVECQSQICGNVPCQFENKSFKGGTETVSGDFSWRYPQTRDVTDSVTLKSIIYILLKKKCT